MVLVFISGDVHAAQPADESTMRGATARVLSSLGWVAFGGTIVPPHES